ncbi:MAG: hypothetical protein R3234_01485 [Thermoanaerobaculia bacterium]|nr:hypothetical protein [Thermoanaerobaculia bacterium]
MVWASLLAFLAQLLPTPFVDDLLEGRVRRRMAERLAGAHGVSLSRGQAKRLVGRTGGWSVGRVARKAVLYPIKKIFRKVIYVLAVKSAMDSFSDVFHHGFLLHSALSLGALEEISVPDEKVEQVGGAIDEIIAGSDTRPVGNAIKGVFRNSRRRVRRAVAWLGRTSPRGVEELESTGTDSRALERESPSTEELLDRLLLVLWGREDHLRGLDRRLERSLAGGKAPRIGR